MGKSKIVYGGETLIDLTGDTIEKEKLLKGYTAHGADGEPITGTCDYDANSSDITPGKAASDSEILKDKEAWVNGSKKVGTMPNKGGVKGTISEKGKPFSIEKGYHDGSGTVDIDDVEKAKLIPSNIRGGVTILGVTGTMSGSEDEKKQSKEVTPTKNGFSVLPDDGFTCLTEVVVNPIPYVETPNSAGGITVTIG